jgi:methionyl-tRNA synthetase
MSHVPNWYFKLTQFNDLLKEYVDDIKKKKNVRRIVSETMEESLGAPVIYIQEKFLDQYLAIEKELPEHEDSDLENIRGSFTVTFDKLEKREKACPILTKAGIHYRTGKTLVPLRLTGNIEWGVKAPKLEDEEDLTVWVWPESLWAPISFTKAYFKRKGMSDEEWKRYWCDRDATVYQFIGQDNIYFYGVAQMPLWMAQQGSEDLTIHPKDGDLQLTTLVANHHILFLDKKASSSSEIKPPMAADLLDYYTADQLRAHFISLALGNKSVSFMPQPLNPDAKANEPDPVLAQGNLYTNVLNRLVRGCFYSAQKYFDGVLPYGEVSAEFRQIAERTILNYENHMYRFELHQVMNDLDSYIRNASKFWSKNSNDEEKIRQTLIDAFYMVRVAAVLSHPIVPDGCEKICDYLNVDPDRFFSWDNIFADIYDLIDDKEDHKLKELKEKEDFYVKHPSQFKQG